MSLRKALRKYGHHRAYCDVGYGPDRDCTCGLDAALAAPDESVMDAERYRFWRKLWCQDDDLEAMNKLAPEGFDGEDEWDAILDAAMLAAPEKE